MTNISLIQGNITTTDVDAIVNAANPVMLGGGGVDGAIHRVAGRALLDACKQVKPVNGIRCPVGSARITSAGQLKATYVIHTVGPRYRLDDNPEELLRSAYRNTLQLALENHCKSIAFPAISCGLYGYPMDEAAKIALSECSKEDYKALSISFYLFSQSDFDVWQSVYESLKSTQNVEEPEKTGLGRFENRSTHPIDSFRVSLNMREPYFTIYHWAR